MQELTKYVPQIVQDYDGFVYVIDTEIKDIFTNKQIKKAMKKATANAMMLAEVEVLILRWLTRIL